MEAQKKCLECERPVFGRADKKFCSDGCRNAYNNKNKAAATNYIRNVNNLLAKTGVFCWPSIQVVKPKNIEISY